MVTSYEGGIDMCMIMIALAYLLINVVRIFVYCQFVWCPKEIRIIFTILSIVLAVGLLQISWMITLIGLGCGISVFLKELKDLDKY